VASLVYREARSALSSPPDLDRSGGHPTGKVVGLSGVSPSTRSWPGSSAWLARVYLAGTFNPGGFGARGSGWRSG